MNYQDCVIITTAEWVNWLARGYARISQDRIKPFDFNRCDSNQIEFNHLMSTCVDNNLDDEAFVFVQLNKDFGNNYFIYRTFFSNYINSTAVHAFYALTERGQRLLTYEAEISHCRILSDKRLELLWENWCDQQLDLLSTNKGNKFLNILGYKNLLEQGSNSDELQEIIKNSEELFNSKQIENLNKSDKLHIFAWGYITYIFKPLLNTNSFDYIKSLDEFKSDAASSNEDYLTTNSRAITSDRKAIKKIVAFEKQLVHESQTIPLLALLVNIHYANLVNQNIEINFKYLKEDLDLLAFYYDSDAYSRQIAFNVGRQLDEVLVNVLYVAHNFDKYKANETLIGSDFDTIRKEQLNFEQLSFEQFRQDIIEVDNILNQYNLSKDSANNETDIVEMNGNTEIVSPEQNPSLGSDYQEMDDKPTANVTESQIDSSLDKDIVQGSVSSDPTLHIFNQLVIDNNLANEIISESESHNLSIDDETQSLTNFELTTSADENPKQAQNQQLVSIDPTSIGNEYSVEVEHSHKFKNNSNDQKRLIHGIISITMPNLQTTHQVQSGDVNNQVKNLDRTVGSAIEQNVAKDENQLKKLLLDELRNIFPQPNKLKKKDIYESILPFYEEYFSKGDEEKKVLNEIYYVITGSRGSFKLENLKKRIYQDDLFN